MLDPSGDVAHAGRSINDSFERGLTLQCAEQIKKQLEATHPYIRVVLTRFPGETLQPLQNANFANRLHVDAYISLHFYEEHNPKPELCIFTYAHGQDVVSNKNTQALSFLPYDQAHLLNAEKTTRYAHLAESILQQQRYQSLFSVRGVFQIPFKPLVGIMAPAFGLEIGLKQTDDWMLYLEAFTHVIVALTNVGSSS
jgi:N-acetylmuramoyl-L-alanine amidase